MFNKAALQQPDLAAVPPRRSHRCASSPSTCAPTRRWTVNQKLVNGVADDGMVLKIDTDDLPAVVKTVTVTIQVG